MTEEYSQPFTGKTLEDSNYTIESAIDLQSEKRPFSIWLVLLFAMCFVILSMYGLTISLYPFFSEASGLDDWVFIAKKFYVPLINFLLGCTIIYTIFKRKNYGWAFALIMPVYLGVYVAYTLLPNLISFSPQTYPKGDEGRYWGDVIVWMVTTSLLGYWVLALSKSKVKKYYQERQAR